MEMNFTERADVLKSQCANLFLCYKKKKSEFADKLFMGK